MADTPNLQIIYVTGHNGAGKTTLCQQIAEKHADQGWHFIDGDEFRKADPELEQSLVDASQKAIDKMRGTLGNENLVEEVTQHAAEIRAAWEPHFTGVFHKLKEEMVATGKHKLVFPYHCYQSWTLDLLRQNFPGGPNNCKVVEVEVTRDLMKERFVQREVKAGMDHEKQWREDEGQRFKMCRERYGPEYKGNEENYKNFLEWRFMFHREEIKADAGAGVYVVNNDKFDAAEKLEKLFSAQ
jgi:dephospho-CoA kinase